MAIAIFATVYVQGGIIYGHLGGYEGGYGGGLIGGYGGGNELDHGGHGGHEEFVDYHVCI